jgi:hypothetical protein
MAEKGWSAGIRIAGSRQSPEPALLRKAALTGPVSIRPPTLAANRTRTATSAFLVTYLKSRELDETSSLDSALLGCSTETLTGCGTSRAWESVEHLATALGM